jgi:excisionase family DNA binding protein
MALNGRSLYTAKEVIEILRISDSTFRRMVRAKKIAVKYIGPGRGMIRVPASEVARLIAVETPNDNS